jgi:hypothetical protein
MSEPENKPKTKVDKKLDRIREEYGFSQDEIKILHVVNPAPKNEVHSPARDKAQHIAGLHNRCLAAIRNRRIIDEDQDVALLEYPLNDERTPIEVRKAHVIQDQIRYYWAWEAETDVDEEPSGEMMTELLYPENICPKCYRFVKESTCPYCGTTGIIVTKLKKTPELKKESKEIQPNEPVANPWL